MVPKQALIFKVVQGCRAARQLTFNATYLSFERAKRDGHLLPRAPLEGAPLRHLYVTSAINDLLDGNRPESGFPIHLSDGDVGRYLIGQCVWVCLSKEPERKADVDFKRLIDADEVWTLRFARVRRRINGWKVFGRFQARDTFIGLRAYDRDTLRTDGDWKSAIDQTIEDWRAILSDCAPVYGATVDVYLSGPYRDVTDHD